MRLFIAIEIPDAVKIQISSLAQDITRELPGFRRACRWVKPDQYHVTLKFLGECQEDTLEMLKAAMEDSARRHPPFSLSFQRIGTFNKGKSFKVLWLGTEDGSENVAALAKDLQGACEAVGFTRESAPYHPHLTLARSKQAIPLRSLDLHRREMTPDPVGPVEIKAISLIESVLSAQGPAYSTLFRRSLG